MKFQKRTLANNNQSGDIIGVGHEVDVKSDHPNQRLSGQTAWDIGALSSGTLLVHFSCAEE